MTEINYLDAEYNFDIDPNIIANMSCIQFHPWCSPLMAPISLLKKCKELIILIYGSLSPFLSPMWLHSMMSSSQSHQTWPLFRSWPIQLQKVSCEKASYKAPMIHYYHRWHQTCKHRETLQEEEQGKWGQSWWRWWNPGKGTIWSHDDKTIFFEWLFSADSTVFDIHMTNPVQVFCKVCFKFKNILISH